MTTSRAKCTCVSLRKELARGDGEERGGGGKEREGRNEQEVRERRRGERGNSCKRYGVLS